MVTKLSINFAEISYLHIFLYTFHLFLINFRNSQKLVSKREILLVYLTFPKIKPRKLPFMIHVNSSTSSKVI